MKHKVYLKAARDYVNNDGNYSCIFITGRQRFLDKESILHEQEITNYRNFYKHEDGWWDKRFKTKKEKLAASLALLFMHEMTNNPIFPIGF